MELFPWNHYDIGGDGGAGLVRSESQKALALLLDVTLPQVSMSCQTCKTTRAAVSALYLLLEPPCTCSPVLAVDKWKRLCSAEPIFVCQLPKGSGERSLASPRKLE